MEINLVTNSSLTVELNKAKAIIDRFIHSCSHNLRGPLTTIEGLVNVAGTCSTPEEVNQCLDLIQDSTMRMKEMIEKLDQYTCHSKRELVVEEIEPERLIQKILIDFDEEIELERIAVSTHISQSMKWLGDEHIHYLILKNLIGNAIHFSDRSKYSKDVAVNIDIKREQVQVEISDNGIGILEEEKNSIYIPFHRSSIQSKGNGLGLFLVNELIQKLRASISVCSREHVGTSVILSLPNRY